MSNIEAQAKVVYGKIPGVLTITNTRITFVRDGETKADVNASHSKITNLFCSKEGSPKRKIKINLADQKDGYQFQFTSPPAIADSELATFKRIILDIITHNTSAQPGQPPPPVPATPPPTRPAVSSQPSTPQRALPSPYSRSPSAQPTGNQGYPFEVYQKVLTDNPELAALHHDLVVEGGHITEAEFWEGREYLLSAQAAASSQRKGKPSNSSAPRLQTGEHGNITFSLTPQLLSDIFEEFPIVLQAYHENVPKPLTEQQFWERYFSSLLFDRHRASSRNSVAKPDPIFDRYLEKEDDDITPLHERNERVQLFLDLEATQQDHLETGNNRDVTMQAGKRKNVLPVIRRFNEHSERLLDSTLGDEHRSKRMRVEDSLSGNMDYISQIDLDDLHEKNTFTGIAMPIQDSQRFMAGLGEGKDEAQQTIVENLGEVTRSMRSALEGWSTHLMSISVDNNAASEALRSMTENVAARLDSRLRKDDIPPHIRQEMSTCATATDEFLRQFWAIIYPPVPDVNGGQTLGQQNNTPAAKAARMKKMAGYLSGTRAKVNAIVRDAEALGVDVGVMEAAFAPLMASVSKALDTFQAKQ